MKSFKFKYLTEFSCSFGVSVFKDTQRYMAGSTSVCRLGL